MDTEKKSVDMHIYIFFMMYVMEKYYQLCRPCFSFFVGSAEHLYMVQSVECKTKY